MPAWSAILPFTLVPLAAFGVSVLLNLFALRIFPCTGLLDFPERYGMKRARLPYPLGLTAVVTFLAFFLALFPLNGQNVGIAAGVFLLAACSFADDRRQLPALPRLLVQTAVGLLIFLTGTRIFSLTNPLETLTGMPVIPLDTVVIPSPLWSDPSVIGAAFTVGWLVLTMNAMNWFDGIPGQVTTISTIGFLTIGALALSARVGQPQLALLAFVLAGIAAGCLLFDFPPPKAILGDTGAMLFGLLLGTLTIYAGGKVATAFLVLGVPLVDSLIVVTRRIREGKSPLRGGRDHLHHALLDAGWSPRAVILLTMAIGTGFGVTALFLTTVGKAVAAIALFGIMLGLSRYARGRSRSAGR